MKKIFALVALMASLLTVSNADAETFTDWHDLDEVTINQDIEANDAKTIYLVVNNNRNYKDDKQDEKQDAAYDDFGEMMQKTVQKAYKGAKVELVANAPANLSGEDLVLTFGFKTINWGSAAARQMLGFGLGDIKGTFGLTVSNSRGTVCEVTHKRNHNTTFASAKGHKVINAFEKAFVEDTLTVLKNL